MNSGTLEGFHTLKIQNIYCIKSFYCKSFSSHSTEDVTINYYETHPKNFFFYMYICYVALDVILQSIHLSFDIQNSVNIVLKIFKYVCGIDLTLVTIVCYYKMS